MTQYTHSFEMPTDFPPLQQDDEFMHRVPDGASYELTETSYFGFCVPDKAINGEIYIWLHPVLKVMSASVYIWQGFKGQSLAADYVNHIHYLPMVDQLQDYELPMGLKVKVVDPFNEVRISYEDAAADTSFNLTYRAFGPAVSRPGGHHFVQPMRVTGSLKLRGADHAIDAPFMRDKSWGQPRTEARRPMPPSTWMAGCFEDGRVLHVHAFDDLEQSPEWAGDYMFPPAGMNLVWGYVQINQRIIKLKHAQKKTHRAANGVQPLRYEMVLIDEEGGQHTLTGEVKAALPWQTWQNMLTWFSQTHWQWQTDQGVVHGVGDTQDIQFNDYVAKHFVGTTP
ncbi:MAG: hypothetical protein ACPG06_02620 [Alphaproteobacteria bacterium]